jgi:hypothetical protein
MKSARSLLLLLALSVPALSLFGQVSHEITPFASFVAGGSPDASGAFGLTYCRFFNADQALEVTVMVQPTTLKTEEGSVKPEVDFNVEYYHVGGRYSPAYHKSLLRPFVSMTLGVSRFVASPGGDEAGFSVGFGAGGDLALSKSTALRLDARLYSTIALSSAQIYCEPQYCTAFTNGSVFTQFSGSLGLVFKF